MKKLLVITVVFILALSCVSVSADETSEEKKKNSEDFINSLAEGLDYDGDTDDLIDTIATGMDYSIPSKKKSTSIYEDTFSKEQYIGTKKLKFFDTRKGKYIKVKGRLYVEHSEYAGIEVDLYYFFPKNNDQEFYSISDIVNGKVDGMVYLRDAEYNTLQFNFYTKGKCYQASEYHYYNGSKTRTQYKDCGTVIMVTDDYWNVSFYKDNGSLIPNKNDRETLAGIFTGSAFDNSEYSLTETQAAFISTNQYEKVKTIEKKAQNIEVKKVNKKFDDYKDMILKVDNLYVVSCREYDVHGYPITELLIRDTDDDQMYYTYYDNSIEIYEGDTIKNMYMTPFYRGTYTTVENKSKWAIWCMAYILG